MTKHTAYKMVLHLRHLAQERGNINIVIDYIDTDTHGAVIRIHNCVTDEITERWGTLTHERYKAMRYEVRNIEW